MRGIKYIICIILAVHVLSLAGQSRSDLRELFAAAEGDLLFEDYAEALPKYMSLLQMYPENYNLYFRIGQCYLNTPGEKDQSIPWLETASGHIDPDYRGGRLKESGAPYDALYFLANAYRINNNFDRALETYELFLKDVDTEKYDTALVRFQIQTCHNARTMMRKPVFITEANLGQGVNDRFSEFNPVISADEKTLLFTRELQFYDAIFWSRKTEDNWTEPVNLTPQLGVDQDYYTSSLSPDGKTLLMYRIDTYDGNIYTSRLIGDTWTKVEKLNGNINTRYWESHATMSSDGERLYFTSNRRESLGSLDIFVSARDSLGNWGPAVNIGPEINTVYNEDTPFLANNDRTLFFSSRGHFNIGGYDIFRSDLDENGEWSTPVNIGYPLNTTDDDLFFNPVGDGNRAYHARFSDEGFGRMDLFACNIYTEGPPPPSQVKEMEAEAFTDTVSQETVPLEPSDISGFQNLPSDSLTTILSSDTLNYKGITGKNILSNTGVVAPDSVIKDEREPDLDREQVREQEGENRDEQVSTPETGATVTAAVVTSDNVTAATAPVTASVTGDKDSPDIADAATRAGTVTFPAGAGDDNTVQPGTHGEGKCCCWWWLLLAGLLLFFFLLWRRKKKKKDDEQ